MSFLWKKLFGDDTKKQLPKVGVVEESSSSSSSFSATTTTTTTTSSSRWKVVRLAVKDREERLREGGDLKSPQRKVPCDKLIVLPDGVRGRIVQPSRKEVWNVFFDTGGDTPPHRTRTTTTMTDHNHYRTQGHGGRFEARTNDRAASIATAAAYRGRARCGY